MHNSFIQKLLVSSFTLLAVLAVTPTVHAAGTFSISPMNGNFLRSCNQSTNIVIDIASGTTNAADITVNYDISKIEIIDAQPSVPGTQILPGNAFESYAGNSVDTLAGKIKLVGYSASSLFNSNATFATILYRSKPLATNGGFTIDFTGANPFNTLDSNIADSTTSFDMLSGVTNAAYTFSAGSCATDTAPPVVTFVTPKNLANSVAPTSPVTFTLTDALTGVSLPSLEIYINGIRYTSISPEVTVSGTPANYSITVTPSTPFPTNSVSVISVTAADAAGNSKTSSISINSGFSCPVTYVTVTKPGLCPTVAPTSPPSDRESPLVIVKSTTKIDVSKDFDLIFETTDNNGISPESFILTIGKQSYTVASTPDRIKVSGAKYNYTFTVTIKAGEVVLSDDGTLVGTVKILDLQGNARLEQLILQTNGKVKPIVSPSAGTTFQTKIVTGIVTIGVPTALGIYLLAYGILSTQPTIARITDKNKKVVRFPKGYIVHHNGSKRKLFGDYFGKLHGHVPNETVTLIVQKYGFNSTNVSIPHTVKHETKQVTLQSL